MTAGSPPHPVQTFQDVLDHGYKIILVGNLELYLLADAKNDSAKHQVWKAYFEDDTKKIEEWISALDNGDEEKAGSIEVPSWYNYTTENFELATKQIMEDRYTLWYCHKDCATQEIEQGNVIDLQMDDMSYSYGGFMLSKDSEYLSLISHYVKKGFETGIYSRIHLVYSTRTPIKIGLTEPGPLGMRNTMFLFTFLGTFILLSLLVAIVENLIKMCKNSKVHRNIDTVQKLS